jgi:uncharacterized protein YciU (UPF0263 family)
MVCSKSLYEAKAIDEAYSLAVEMASDTNPPA